MTLKQLYEVASKFESALFEKRIIFFEVELDHTFGDLAKFKLDIKLFEIPTLNIADYEISKITNMTSEGIAARVRLSNVKSFRNDTIKLS